MVGRFFRECWLQGIIWTVRLNPHVVGRFFRGKLGASGFHEPEVLIPMWWGGFSEDGEPKELDISSFVLIPMWWGGFSESGGMFSLLNSNA